MKLGLLVVVAVAVLLPSFSESRTVSKCELRDKLVQKIKLPRRLEEGILATVICEVNRRSHLNTAMVTGIGKPVPTTPTPTVITTPSTTAVSKMTTTTTIQPTSANSTTTQPTNTTTTITNPTTINPTTNTTTTNTTTANPITINTTTTNTTATNTTATNTTATNTANPITINTTTTNTTATNTTATNTTATNSTATNTTASPATTNSTIILVNSTLVLNSTGGIKRRKREVDSSSEEDAGFYGLFQLSDRDFCDSGYHQSENECRTSCTAFTDDDITDDIACAIKTGYWRQIFESASDSCHQTSNFFKECY